MKVILSANVTHYYYAALALEQAGLLRRYLCSIAICENDRWIYRWMPPDIKSKLMARELRGIPRHKVRRSIVPELLQVGGSRLGLISVHRSNWINNQLYDLWARRQIDTCDVFHFVSSVGLRSAQRAKNRGAIVVCDQRSEYPDSYRRAVKRECDLLRVPYDPPGRLYDDRVKKEYEISDYIIVGSTYSKETFVRAGFPRDKMFVVPLGVNLTEFPDDQKHDTVFRIIYCGRINAGKGVHYLVDAFERLQLSNAELMLIGRVDPSMESFANNLRNRKHISVLGHIPRRQLFRYYHQGSVFVLPSVSDNFPLVTAEAMACGLPAIVTENTGSREMVRDGKDGFIVPVRDPATLANRIAALYQDPVLCYSMGISARRRAREFTWEQYGANLLSVYEAILTRGVR